MVTASPLNEDGAGILVYRASRLEALLTPLELLLRQFQPAQVLMPQTIIAAHPGMKHWLVGALARLRGGGGIVANLRVLLPSDWLDELAQSALGSAAVALQPYRREHLRWRIFELLPTLAHPEIAAYLQGTDAERRRFQLADRLARLYTQYMVYRPDWLQAWQNGRGAGPASFQSSLWQALRLQIAQPHRAERLGELVAALQRAASPLSGEPLHVFGMSHLAPVELHVLRAVARHRPVALYVPDPCREYWGGLRGERAQLRALAAQPVDGDLQQALLQIDHPLLADWGRMGQHFVLALNEGEGEVRVDSRHWEDLQTDSALQPRLAQVQESVRRLHDATLLTPGSLLHAAALEDRSLRVHACHTPLRELEVLRDALLMELRQRPDLHPADIVVMAPDIQRYLPLLPAVFGAAGARNALLPYATADAALARSHPVFVAFLSLLDVPGARMTAPQIVDLLQVPALARALGLDAAGSDQLIAWLRESRVAWGLDAEFRLQFDVPAIAEHSFAWAVDRMLAGHVFGTPDVDAEAQAFDGVLPLPGIHGAHVPAIGALDRLLLELAALHQDSRAPRPASAWVRRFAHLIDALFDRRHADDDERAAIAELHRLVQLVEQETRAAELDPLLEFAVLRDLLRAHLAAAPGRQRLLRGGVTFCGMVPQRSIPFRVIAVLGLNEGDYPRQAPDLSLDLMQQQRRLGDRDVRDDDRYLFLETLMAARDSLHLSYVGEGVRDGRRRNPAAPLAELMHFLDARAELATLADAERLRPWLVRHPLQPFDARYFDGSDPRLFSFRAEFAAMVPTSATQVPAASGLASSTPPATAAIVRVDTLRAFYRDPARLLCNQMLQLRLDALEDERLGDTEPLQARTEAIDRVGRRLFFDALDSSDEVSEVAPDWLRLSGLLPAGRLGAAAYKKERHQAQALLQIARAHPQLANGVPAPHALQVDIAIGGSQLQGRLGTVRAGADAWLLLDAYVGKKLDDLGFRERVPLFLEWALLRLHLIGSAQSVRVCLLTLPASERSSSGDDWPRVLNDVDTHIAEARAQGDRATLHLIHADIADRLSWLLRLFEESAAGALRYFPQTSWAAAQGALAEVTHKMTVAWQGDGFNAVGERDRAPGYAGWIAPSLELPDDAAALHAIHQRAQALRAVIGMDALASWS